MKNLFLILILPFIIIGCAGNEPKISNTKTGNPEIVISKPVKTIKPLLINDALDRGYSLVSDTDYALTFSRPPRAGGESFALALQGNKYTQNSLELQYTLVETAGKTRVIAKMWSKIAFPMGQVKRHPSNGPKAYNAIQGFFNDLKQRVE